MTNVNPGLIYKKMLQVAKNIGAVGKGQKNTQQGYSFRGIDDLMNSVGPALIEAGVFVTVESMNRSETIKDVTRSNGKSGVDKHVSLRVKYTFHAEDGSNVSSTVDSEGLDSGDKATNKALSAAFKYALIQTFVVATVDMEDADRTSPEHGKPVTAVRHNVDGTKTTLTEAEVIANTPIAKLNTESLEVKVVTSSNGLDKPINKTTFKKLPTVSKNDTSTPVVNGKATTKTTEEWI